MGKKWLKGQTSLEMAIKSLVIGTRCSKLALIQSSLVKEALERTFPDLVVELKEIKTTGDVITDIPLEKIGDKGIFIKELEAALLKEEIDLAVHSMKDMPTTLQPGLKIGAIMEREEPWDVFISAKKVAKLSDLAKGVCIGSSSLRRRAQLLHHYPNLEISSIRGNLDTRLKKMQRGECEGIILAYAGVKRMGWTDLISEIIPGEICLPSVGQGAIGIEIRSDDRTAEALVKALHCARTGVAVEAERAFLRRLEGGCQVPIGALARCNKKSLQLTGMVASLDGNLMFRDEKIGSIDEAETIGINLAEDLLQEGCGSILDQIRQECELNDE